MLMTPAAIAAQLSFWAALPFLAVLLLIALMPALAPHWWESNRNRGIVMGLIALPFAAWFMKAFGDGGKFQLIHAAVEYFSFISLILSLYLLGGGVYLRGSLAGTPLANTAMLAIGALLANLVGTTGASMILIRPLLRANKKRVARAHIIVFFIFIVANCGGLLTPLGDPPLYLGFLKGVPFAWTFSLWRPWLLVNGILLVLFNLLDQSVINKEEAASETVHTFEEVMQHEPLRIEGKNNLVLLGLVVLVVVARGQHWGFGPAGWPVGLQEGLLLLLSGIGYLTTSQRIRMENNFSFGPILEVAILFAGIFATMTAPLLLLNAHAKELALDLPWHFFWASGMLSSVLDNAPTYLAMAATAAGQAGVEADGPFIGRWLATGDAAHLYLTAVACGSVFMGALTYIGNGPNFMVRAVAEENGVKMPSFFAYMRYAVLILVPIFILVTLVLF